MKFELINLGYRDKIFSCVCGKVKTSNKAYYEHLHCNDCNSIVFGSKILDYNTSKWIAMRLSSDNPITNEEIISLIKKKANSVARVFKNFNKTVCSNCTPERKVNVNECRRDGIYNEMGCCWECNYGLGYFWMCDRPKELEGNLMEFNVGNKKLKFRFDPNFGFFDIKKHKCSLPRYLRSSTCLKACCDTKLRKKVRNNVEIIERLKKYLDIPF